MTAGPAIPRALGVLGYPRAPCGAPFGLVVAVKIVIVMVRRSFRVRPGPTAAVTLTYADMVNNVPMAQNLDCFASNDDQGATAAALQANRLRRTEAVTAFRTAEPGPTGDSCRRTHRWAVRGSCS